MLELWSSIVEKNALPPPSRAAAPPSSAREPAVEPLLRRMVDRRARDLPGPLPGSLFDEASAWAMARVVACALGRLHPGSASGGELLAALGDVPVPRTPAQHVTQAAVAWPAIPIARRMQSDGFRALNRGETDGEAKEAIGDRVAHFLGSRPLLSLDPMAEEIFAADGPPVLEGIEPAVGLRRWLLQALASKEPAPSVLPRRVATIRAMDAGWDDPDRALRELLLLRSREAAGAAAGFLPPFLPLLGRGGWPEDLAPDLRRQALELRVNPDPDEDASHDPRP